MYFLHVSFGISLALKRIEHSTTVGYMANYLVYRRDILGDFSLQKLSEAYRVCKEALVELGFELQLDGFWYQRGITETVVSFQFDKLYLYAMISGQVIRLTIIESRWNFDKFFHNFLSLAGRLIHIKLDSGTEMEDHFVSRTIYGEAIVKTVKHRLGHDRFKAYYKTSLGANFGEYKPIPPSVFQHITHL